MQGDTVAEQREKMVKTAKTLVALIEQENAS